MSKFLRSLLFAVIVMGCFDGYAQRVAIKTNAIDWLTMTPNLGLETRLSPRFSLDISVAVNPFDVSIMDVSNRNMRIQPELRYWFNRPMARHYMGLALLGGFYDTKIRSRIYEGDIIAGGLIYGYALVLSRHWNVEFTAGIGVGKMRAYKYRSYEPKPENINYSKWTIVPMRLGVSFSYIFK